MKILMVLLDRFFPPDIRVEKEARTLLKANHEVFLLSLDKEGVPSEELVEGIRVIRRSPPQGLPLPKRAWGYFWFQISSVDSFWVQTLTEIVRQYQIEALHIHDLPMVKMGLQVARKFDIPLTADLHENMPEAIRGRRRSGWQGRLGNPVWRWKRLERLCVQRADRVITVVDETREHYINDCRIPPEKVITVMNAEDLDYFYSIPISEGIVNKYSHYFIISYVGGLGWHRGIQTAISAMPLILQAIPNAKLLIVGSGGNEAELRELVTKEEAEQAVEFTGWQDFNLVPSFIAVSKVCLIPYLITGNTDNALPHKLFQYMAMGKPVVVSSAKTLERIVNETGAGLVYPSGDAQALAEAIIKIYQHGGLATRLGEAGKRAVEERYNWGVGGKKLVRLYQDLGEKTK